MQFRKSGVSMILSLLPTLLAGCATDRTCNSAACMTNEKTTAAVQSAFAKHPDLGAPGAIRVETTDHVVYLYGEVDSGLERESAGSVASQVMGVTRVVNSIGISK